jgi:hypothetical protein
LKVANYNVHPAVTLTANKNPPQDIDIRVFLFEESQKRLVKNGLQTNTTKTWMSSQQSLIINGLKLGKMGTLKKQLNLKHTDQLDHSFYLVFKVEGTNLESTSSTFKIVSSCTQVPPDKRDYIRPMKPEVRMKKMEKQKLKKRKLESAEEQNQKQRQIRALREWLEQSLYAGDVKSSAIAAEKLALLHRQNEE